MKKLLCVLLVLGNSSSFADDVCVAQMTEIFSYGGTMNYKVVCSKNTFDTAQILTSLILPIPYDWEAAARKHLKQEMAQKGYQEIAKQKIVFGDSENVLRIFERTRTRASYCAVIRHNFQNGQADQKKRVFDAAVFCSIEPKKEIFKAVTMKEVATHMESRGFRNVLEANFNRPDLQDASKWLEKVTIFKK